MKIDFRKGSHFIYMHQIAYIRFSTKMMKILKIFG